MNGLKLLILCLLWVAWLPANAQKVTYFHTDALGSPVVLTDANRDVVERREYEPYGRQLTPAPQDGPGYTGHVYDAATGMVYMQQRYYDPSFGRFISTDPIVARSGSRDQFNRYWYANNNPYKFIDPDGRKIKYGKAPAEFLRNAAKAIRYLNKNGVAAPIGEVAAHKETVTVVPAKDRTDASQTNYNSKTKTLTWADQGGLEVRNYKTGEIETISPALALGHEFAHATNNLNAPESFTLDVNTYDQTYDTQEERNVIEEYERPAAHKLGEGERGDHSGHPISSQVCPGQICQ